MLILEGFSENAKYGYQIRTVGSKLYAIDR
jgi:hypothetical protein